MRFISFRTAPEGNIWTELLSRYPLDDVINVIHILKKFGYFKSYREKESLHYYLEILAWWPSSQDEFSSHSLNRLDRMVPQLFFLTRKSADKNTPAIRFFVSKTGRVRVLTRYHSRLFKKRIWDDPGKEFGKRPIFNSIEEFIAFLEV